MTTPNATYSLAKDVLLREIDGEAVLLNLQSGKYYGLNETGTRMVNLLQAGNPIDAAVRALADHYDAPESRLREDLVRLVEELLAHGLIHPVSA